MSEITKAIVAARMSVTPTVYKAGKNDAQRYAYAGHEHVVTHARAAMCSHGLSLEQTQVTYERDLTYVTRNGEQHAWLWRGDFLLSHVGGESRSYSFVATTGANDKAAYVASTALDRTAILRIMQLAGSLSEDPEHDSNEAPLAESSAVARVTGDLSAVQSHVDVALAKCANQAQIVQWARDLMRMDGEKTQAWQAFAAQCAVLRLPPGDVAREARK